MKNIYQLKIHLKSSKPAVYRVIQIEDDKTLSDLHQIIQIAMGWESCHLFQFVKGKQFYSDTSIINDWGVIEVSEIKIKEVLSKVKEKISYEYDFGDGWMHDITLQKILPPDPKQTYPVCISGKNNCPPEDCGGVWGYRMLLEAIKDENHPEHEEMVEWVGEDFEPQYWSVEAVNAVLS